ncbi:MAG TPA: hypothetical protein VEA80_18050 [Vitreimonas sp.]|uniref:hypothetical protein n=1 Tax=Vitreimonas sp. TaxID=3069702 RepID=UPI002D605044|nr:hypothetical protein [Vitreimonas sp.]HYD89387.1 hypothetical protein [Vitreimonas sp.]
MTKLDLVLARLKELPPDRQDMIAVEIEFMLDHPEPLLTDEQRAELRRRAEEEQGDPIPHEDIVAEFLPAQSK